MEKLINEFTHLRNWAVVGASNSPSKYGYKIFNVMNNNGYRVFGVNPKGGELFGQRLFPNLESLKNEVKFNELVVDVVVPPEVTENIVKECKNLGISRVWLQPGSESKQAIEFCKNNGIGVVFDDCAMVRAINWKRSPL